jgi:hypothetical protein
MYILFPNPPEIEIVNLYTGETAFGDDPKNTNWTLRRYIIEVLLTDPALGQGYESFSIAHDISEELKKADAEGRLYVSLPKTHIDRLTKVITSPQTPRNPAGMSQMLPFMEAIKNPVKELPEELAQVEDDRKAASNGEDKDGLESIIEDQPEA